MQQGHFHERSSGVRDASLLVTISASELLPMISQLELPQSWSPFFWGVDSVEDTDWDDVSVSKSL